MSTLTQKLRALVLVMTAVTFSTFSAPSFANDLNPSLTQGIQILEGLNRGPILVPTPEELRECEAGNQKLSPQQAAGYALALNLYGSLKDPVKSLRASHNNLKLLAELIVRRLHQISSQLNDSDQKEVLKIRDEIRTLVQDLEHSAQNPKPEALVSLAQRTLDLYRRELKLNSDLDNQRERHLAILEGLQTSVDAVKAGSKLTIVIGTGILSGGVAAGSVSAGMEALDQIYTDYALDRPTDYVRLARSAAIEGLTGTLSGGSASLVKGAATQTGKLLALSGASEKAIRVGTTVASAGVGHEVDSVAAGIGVALDTSIERALTDDEQDRNLPDIWEAGVQAYFDQHSIESILTGAGAAKARSLMMNLHMKSNPDLFQRDSILAKKAAIKRKEWEKTEQAWSKVVLKKLNDPLTPELQSELNSRWKKIDEQKSVLSQLPPAKRSVLTEKLRAAQMKNSYTAKGLSGTPSHLSPEDGKMMAQYNFKRADGLVEKWIKTGESLSLDKIQELNRVLGEGMPHNGGNPGELRGQGFEVGAGQSPNTLYVPGGQVDSMMKDFVRWYHEAESQKMPPIELAARSYQRLVSIHPFSDGNGRTSRMVMDWILQKHGLPPATLHPEEVGVAIFSGMMPMGFGLTVRVIPEQQSSPDLAVEKITRGVERSLKIAQTVNESVLSQSHP